MIPEYHKYIFKIPDKDEIKFLDGPHLYVFKRLGKIAFDMVLTLFKFRHYKNGILNRTEKNIFITLKSYKQESKYS